MATTNSDRRYQLGSLEASEQLIQDLYLDLRRKTRFWAGITQQTAQARMGYVGQHLVSIVTGSRGGRSGARGFDLVHSDGIPGEIKTCYRVDQLGACRACKAGVAPDEDECPECGSTDLERKDDSKWLISFRHDDEFSSMLVPKTYYLVLFEFVDLYNPDTIQASVWSVDPRNPGFILAMVDYYKNIRANSKSKAPFNLWPYSLKFEIMRADLIYRSLIHKDDTIETQIFPGREAPAPTLLSNLSTHSRARVDVARWTGVWSDLRSRGAALGAPPRTKATLLQKMQEARASMPVSEAEFSDIVAVNYYKELLANHRDGLPQEVGARVSEILDG